MYRVHEMPLAIGDFFAGIPPRAKLGKRLVRAKSRSPGIISRQHGAVELLKFQLTKSPNSR